MTALYRTYSDGGARGNPGHAGIGAVIIHPDGTRHTIKKYIGHATNNQAEYQALIAALAYLADKHVAHAECMLDSELLVKQMRREYRVKDTILGTLFLQAQKYALQIRTISFHHIPREKNKEADALVNQAIDEHLY